MRIMTWNIHGGVGLDGRRDINRVVRIIREANPDILALQEVDNRAGEPSMREQLVGYKHIAATAISTPDGDYGQLLLSRWPLNQAEVHDISAERREPRRLISATVTSPDGDVRVLATHLGLRFNERAAQAAVLCERGRDMTLPTLALGDFNDWFRWHSIQPLLDQTFAGKTTISTFPSRLPFFALDRIYWNGLDGTKPRTLAHASLASDHLPVIIDAKT
jgi:endonuclease/exonuclease/phosphatase family metal-dependent hydrolase